MSLLETPPSIYESANLQERARQDHQETLELIRKATARLGGSTFYNNYLDLYLRIGEHRFVVEAKSLNNPQRAVDRMRYGMGQLFDYRIRLAAEISGAHRCWRLERCRPLKHRGLVKS
jgi:hypothetical protein